jgi:hypothetical protein
MASANRQYRTRPAPHHVLRRRSEEGEFHAASALRAHDDQVGASCFTGAKNLTIGASKYDAAFDLAPVRDSAGTTLSACDTGTGVAHGQEGVSSLVRPFLAAGARTVVANLRTADDRFSLALMREFYWRLSAGADIAGALRGAKLRMIELFGPQAVPKLWSGVLAYGDGVGTVTPQLATTR